MPAYIAMLRGINVSGHKIVRMQDLRRLCESLGFRFVTTYVQSGNIIFLDDEKSPSRLATNISDAILREFGWAVPVFVRTAKEMNNLVENNPFLQDKGIDPSKLHVTFLSEAVPKESLKKLEKLSSEQDRFYPRREEILLYCPGGYGRAKLSNTVLEKALSVEATTRNWKTVNMLSEMASEL